MKSVKFLAVAILLVAFFVSGCASTGSGDGEMSRFQKLLNGAIVPIRNDVAVLKAKPDPNLGPVNQTLAEHSDRLAAVEAGLANLRQDVTAAVQTGDAAQKTAKDADTKATGAHTLAVAAKAESARALKIAQGELSPQESTRARQQFAPRIASASHRDFVEEKGIFELPLASGSSKISQKQIEALEAFLDARGLKIISIVGVEDRHLKAASEKEAERINRDLARDRVQSAKVTFKDWISDKATDRISTPPPAPSKFPGGLFFLLGKD